MILQDNPGRGHAVFFRRQCEAQVENGLVALPRAAADWWYGDFAGVAALRPSVCVLKPWVRVGEFYAPSARSAGNRKMVQRSRCDPQEEDAQLARCD